MHSPVGLPWLGGRGGGVGGRWWLARSPHADLPLETYIRKCICEHIGTVIVYVLPFRSPHLLLTHI